MAQKLICFIDLENRMTLDLNQFIAKSKSHYLVVVGGPGTTSQIEKLNPNPRIRIVKASASRDQRSDKLLLAKLGQFVEREKNSKFVIVSADKEFTACVDDLGFVNVTCSPGLPTPHAQTTGVVQIAESTLEMMMCRSAKKRPRKISALIQSISDRNHITRQKAQAVVDHLTENRLIAETSKRIVFGLDQVKKLGFECGNIEKFKPQKYEQPLLFDFESSPDAFTG